MSKHSTAEQRLHLNYGRKSLGKYAPQRAARSNIVPQPPPKRANFKNQYR